MTAHAETDVPFHFGADAELFGLYHPVATPATKAVLLCPPLGQDLIRCHRLYRQLAQALAAAGLPVLRFDYYGSGDSAGRSADLHWTRCLDDIVSAATELRARSGCGRVLAFGARMGGSAAIASAASAGLAALVLWDPIVDGAAHVAQLDAMQDSLQHDTRRFLKPRTVAAIANQWLGFDVSGELRRQLLALHIEPSSVPTWVVDSNGWPTWKAFGASHATTIALHTRTPWDDPGRLELAIQSHELIRIANDLLQGA